MECSAERLRLCCFSRNICVSFFPQALSGILHSLSNFTLRTRPSSLKILPGMEHRFIPNTAIYFSYNINFSDTVIPVFAAYTF